MDLDWPYQNQGKHFIAHVKHISGNISKILNNLKVIVHFGKYVRNHCFYIFGTASTKHR